MSFKHTGHTDFYTDVCLMKEYTSEIREKHPNARISGHDLEKLEKWAVEPYRKNEIVKESVKKEKKIMAAFEELDSDMNGIFRFLPRYMKKAYNRRVDAMVKVAPATSYLKRKGILYPDNVVSGAIYGGAALGEGVYWLVRLIESNGQIPEDAKDCALMASIPMSLMGFISGAMASQNIRSDGKVSSIEQVKYVDNFIYGSGGRIRELFC
jgi:hypothetical protein